MNASTAAVPRDATPGARALAQALGVTLKVLKICLVAGLALYFASGVCVVPDGHEAVVLNAGRLAREVDGSVRVYAPGTYFTLPPPLGARVVIPVREVKSIATETFWYREEAEDQLRALRRTATKKPLVPGRDGYVLCGDGAILHLRVRADWRVGDAARYYAFFGNGARIDTAGEQSFVAAMLAEAVLRNALTVRMLAMDDAASGKAEYFGKVKADLAPVLAARGLALEAVSPLIRPQEPRQVEEAFVRSQNAANAALSALGEARKAATAVRTDAEARANEIVATAQSEAKEIFERARRDVMHTAELAAVLARDPTLRARLTLDACVRAFKNADIRPLAAPGERGSFRYTLTPAAQSKEKEKSQ